MLKQAFCKGGPRSRRYIAKLNTKNFDEGNSHFNDDSDDSLRRIELLPQLQAMQETTFKDIGTNSDLLKIDVAPSQPLFCRRHSIVSLSGSLENIKSKVLFMDPIRRFVYGGHNSRYDELASTEPFLLLIGSSSKEGLFRTGSGSASQSLAVLELDGRTDYAILHKRALQVFTGPSLHVRTYLIPKFVSRQLGQRFGVPRSTRNGLSSWSNLGYTFVGGRGKVGVLGMGQICSFEIQDGEEALFEKSHILGISVNGPQDLQNCAMEVRPLERKEEKTTPIHDIVTNTTIDRLQLIKNYAVNTSLWLVATYKRIAAKIQRTRFIKVAGPRIVIIQSKGSKSAVNGNFRVPKIFTNKESPGAAQPENFLNEVSISTGGKPSIQSVERLS